MLIDKNVIEKVLKYEELKKKLDTTKEVDKNIYKKMELIKKEICKDFGINNDNVNSYSLVEEFCKTVIKLNKGSRKIVEIIFLNEFIKREKWEESKIWLFKSLSCDYQQQYYFENFYDNYCLIKERINDYVCIYELY